MSTAPSATGAQRSRSVSTRRPATSLPNCTTAQVTTPTPTQTSRYPEANTQVGTNVPPRARFPIATVRYISSIGAAAGNIIAAIMTPQAITKVVNAFQVQPSDAIP